MNGLLISVLPACLLPFLQDTVGSSTIFGDTDYGVMGILLGYVMMLL
jgi:PTS system ascorbate-specific IIC component